MQHAGKTFLLKSTWKSWNPLICCIILFHRRVYFSFHYNLSYWSFLHFRRWCFFSLILIVMTLFFSDRMSMENRAISSRKWERGPERDPWRGADLGQGYHQLSEAAAVCVWAVQVLLSVCVQRIQSQSSSVTAVQHCTATQHLFRPSLNSQNGRK